MNRAKVIEPGEPHVHQVVLRRDIALSLRPQHAVGDPGATGAEGDREIEHRKEFTHGADRAGSRAAKAIGWE